MTDMTKPRISVIIPVYNAENTLGKCIESVINQTFRDTEIILINDGSTDKSLEIAEKYAQQDSRVKIINQGNHGLSEARNVGIKTAQGEYISFVDSDDWIGDEKMYDELVTQAEEHNNPNIIKAYHYKVTSTGITPTVSFHYPNKENKKAVLTNDLTEIMKDCSYAIWSGLWKTNFLHKHSLHFAKDIRNGSDILFTWQAMILSREILLIFKPYYCYNLATPFSVTRSINNKFLDLLKVFNSQKEFITGQKVYEKFKHTYQTRAYSYFSFGFKRALMLRGFRFHRYPELKRFFDEMRKISGDWDVDKIDFENTFEKQKFLALQENNFIKFLVKTLALDTKIRAFWLYVIKN